MDRRERCLAVVSFVCFLIGVSTKVLAQIQPPAELRPEPEIWLSPQALPLAPLNQDVDFMAMFAPGAPWNFAAAHTRVFKLHGSFVSHASQEEINTVVADLSRRGIPIALEIGVMDVGTAKTGAPCGGLGRVEGYGTPADAEKISAIVKAAGGTLKYLSFDEPLYYGHYYDGPYACQSTIAAAFQLVIPTVNTYIQEFPDIIIGDNEPTNIAAYDGWREGLLEWATDFLVTFKRPFAFMQLDIPWANGPPSKEPEDALAFYHYVRMLQRQGLYERVGIIIDGTPDDSSDAAWVEDARHHVLLLESTYGLRPDQDLFESWNVHPTHALPETRPDTLTSLIPWYFEPDVEALTGRGGPVP